MVSKSRKHARTVKLNSAVNNAIEKAVDARKVAAFTIGAAGVLAGAAFAFGATPAMAAEAGTTPDTKPAPVTAGEKPGVDKKAEADKNNQADGKSATDEKTDNNTLKNAHKTKDNKSKLEQNLSKEKKASTQSVVKADGKAGEKQVEQNKIADQNTASTESVDKKVTDSTAAADNTDAASSATAETTASAPAKTPARKRTRRALGNTQTDAATSENQERASDNNAASQDPNKIKPNTTDATNTKIEINENNAETMPNMYGWGSSDNTYSVNGETHTVTFNFAKPNDDGKITNIAIFPAQNNGLTNEKSRKGAEYYSGDPNMHQSFSGTYKLVKNQDGSADLTMSTLFSIGKVSGGAEKYVASRSIFVYVTKDNKETVAYKTNVFRAVTLVPPKTSGSVVLKYNQELTPEKVQAAITEAGNVETARSDKKSVNDQLSGAFTQNINVKSADAYDAKQFEAINTKKTGDANSYVAGAKTLNTYMVTDLGFKSGAIPLTVARYDDRIDKPIVEDPDSVSDDVKTEIKKKLARLNNVSLDQVTINDQGEFTINFAGVDPKDAPKIALRDLVLKKLTDGEFVVPSNDKAVFVANPLGYSKAEIERIKTAIFEANKDNQELNLTSKDQITLEYVKGDTTVGHENIGISNGQAENTITVKIKTDKSVAEFTSNVKESKLTKLPNIRTDYDVTWTKTKIDGRDTDEGISWSNDSKTTIIYRYDPTKAQEFDTTKILGLLKAKPKDPKSGLRDLTGGEQLDHEDVNGKPRKSHMKYALKDNEPTGELTLGNMGGAYWSGNQKVSNSDVDLGDNLSISGSYSWDPEAGSVTVAGKKDKIFKARLFVEPYAMSYYKDVYLEKNRHPGNTAKAINVIFVPQTNHKTSDLQKSIGEHKTVAVEGKDVPTQHEYYNASDKVKSDYDDALKVAKDLYEQVKDKKESDLTEKQKADIDNATIKLDKARKALDGAKTDKDKLNASIDANGKAAEGATAEKPGTVTTDRYKNVTDQAFQTDDGKPDTAKNEKAKAAKKAYDEALAEANKVKADDNATQKAVDDAKAKLDAARAKLNDFTTNKEKLNAAIAEHGKVKTGDADKQGDDKLKTADPAYQNATKEEREAYDNAVKKANDLSADPNASQKDVNAAIDALQKAKAALDLKATDKSKLITAEKLTFDNPDSTDASKQSTFYKNALNKQTNGANDQEKQAAKTAVDNYNNALTKAREVLKNSKATQKEVDDAKDALTKAEKALHDGYKSDANDLTKALADNVTGYLMPAYFNAFDKAQAGDEDAKKAFKDYNDAYQKAKELKRKFAETNPSNQPTATEIAAAKTALEEARKVIDKYATNTSRLSAAVFNDLAIKLSPAYKNVSADDASAEAKAAKQKYDDAVKKLHQALEKKMPKDKDKATGQDIPDTNIPVKDGKLDDKDYLKNIQAHAQGEPLDRDIDDILKEMNAAAADLNKFATKTDELIKSINEHDNTQKTPAYKNASHPDYKNESGQADTDKNGKASKAVDDYGAALNAAKDLLKNPAATQKEVNDALKTLNEKRAALDAYNTDATKLTESVGKHGNTQDPESAAATEGTVTSDAYRNASDPHFMKEEGGKLVPDTDKNTKAAAAKKAYDEALTKAQELLKKHGDANTPQDAKPTQKDINDALKALDDARTEIEKYKTVTTDLETEANKSTPEHAQVTENDFENTPEFKNADDKKKDGADGKKVDNDDVKAYKDALARARKLAQDNTSKTLSDHHTQKEIDDALEALKKAKQTITDGYKTDVEKLKQAKDYADGAFKQTPEYKNATAVKNDNNNAKHEQAGKDLGDATKQTGFEGQIAKIAEKLKDTSKLTQREVDALVKQLNIAQKKIADDYKTNVTPLSNEVGDKDKDGKPVTPKFEESIPYKNALAKKNAESEEDAKKGDSATKKLEAYNEKLKAAQDLINKVNKPDPNAKPEDRPTQDDVDKALAALKKAKKDIDDAFKTKVDKLQNEVDDKNEDGSARTPEFEKSTEFANLKGKTKDGKKPDDLVAYEKALAKAKELIDKNDGKVKNDQGVEVDVPKDQLPTQKEVDEAKKALKEIKDKILANYKTSPHDLQDEVDKSKDGDTDTDTSTDLFENTPAFKNAQAKGDEAAKQALEDYNKKLQAAKDLLAKFDRKTGKPKDDLPAGEKAPTQQELDKALKDLQDAKKKITDEYSTRKYDLRQEAGKDSDFTKSPEYQNAQAKGDDESKQALEDYKKALDEANSVLDDPNATQSEVDEALKRLKAAKDKLKAENGTDKSQLQTEADDDAKFRKSLYFIIGNKDDIEAYNTALAEANRVLNDPTATQAQVDEALKKLKAAKYKLNHPFGAGSGSGIGYDTNAGDGFAVEANDSQSASVDKSALQVEVNNAVNTNANTAEARAYRKALAEAKRVLADKNATQAQVDEALRNLKNAKSALLNSLRGASGNAGGLANTGAETGLFASIAAAFAGLGVAGVASRRRKHSNE